MANLTLPNLQPFLSAAADAIVPVLPPTLASLALNGTARFAAGTTPYKFASWPNRVPYLDVAAWPAWPVWVVDGWTGTIDGLISTVASYALPGVLGPAVSNWIARALVQVYVMKFFFMLVFFPMFLFYRAADRWGFMDKWKTNPHRSNPDTKAEDKIWAAFFPSVLYSVPWESLTYWLLFYSRGEIALSAVPPLPVFLFKFLFTVWSVDAMYYHFHVWEHRPHVYRWLHKRHHDMKITNVYGFFFVTPLEHHIQAMFGVITNTLLAHTIGQDLFTMCAFTLFGVGTDLHIHSGYAAPFIPFNWWNPQYFHDHHHSQNKGSYGAFFAVPVLSWDWWMGTDQNWRRFRVSGDEVRLHRNTYPGFAVPGDLDKKRTVNDVAEDKDD